MRDNPLGDQSGLSKTGASPYLGCQRETQSLSHEESSFGLGHCRCGNGDKLSAMIVSG